MKIKLIILAALFVSLSAAQRCDSISAALSGGWKPAASAPRDGRTVEMVQTYGVAPWYGIFKWTKESISFDQDGKAHKFIAEKPSWVQVNKSGHGVTESACLFWRPYKATGKYVDPTGGAQDSIAYWCAAMHRPYDPKTDRCK